MPTQASSPRWLCLLVPWLPCERIEREQPALRRKPWVLVQEEHQALRVVTPSRLAWRAGVRPGMKLTSARAALPGLEALDWRAEDDRRALRALAEWCLRLGPKVDVYEERPGFQGVIAEISGSIHLFGNESRLIEGVRRGVARLGYCPRIGLADTPRAAHVQAQAAGNRPAIAPAGEICAACTFLSPDTLMLDPHTSERLRVLGITTIGQLFDLPASTLNARFGESLTRRIAELRGVQPELPRGLHTPDSISERMTFEDALEGGEGLLFALKRLVDRVAERLGGCLLATRRLRLTIGHDGLPATVLEMASAQQQQRARALMLLLNARMEQLELDAPISSLELEALEVEPLANRYQDIFERRARQNPEEFADLLDRLVARLGNEHVVRADPCEDYRPERAWHPTPWLDAGKPRAPQRRPKAKKPAWRDYDGREFSPGSTGPGSAGIPARDGSGTDIPVCESSPGSADIPVRDFARDSVRVPECCETRLWESHNVTKGAHTNDSQAPALFPSPRVNAASASEQDSYRGGRGDGLFEMGQTPAGMPVPLQTFSMGQTRAGMPAPPKLPPRPTRLLSEVRALRVETRRGFPIRVDGCAVVDCQGPERIATGWWQGADAARRDYYALLLADGRRLWVMQDLETKAFALHGMWG